MLTDLLDTKIELVQEEPGVYKAAQIRNISDLRPVSDNENAIDLDWSFGPLNVGFHLGLSSGC